MFTLKNSKMLPCLLFALGIFLLDQISKAIIMRIMTWQQKIELMPSFNFTLTYNNGAAFGILSDAAGWQRWFFCSLALLISSVILVWIARLKEENYLEGFALAAILGGALGNFLDRLHYGYVIDFIDFYIYSWHWYTFNVADIAICLGSVFLLYTSFRHASQ